MNKLEPTYLRYVYDGLHKGSLNAENASALPQGFIGLFESEFPADVSSVERISVLRRLTLWALFKGAASTHLASEVLEEDEEDTKTLIDTYSKWFNSPEPGKYILYHDRLRSYFLQKLSSHEVQSLNEKIISYLEAALKDKREDEAQEYALEHLATHMAVESQLDNNYDRLHDFVNQEDLWKIQVRTSKQYKWSQQAVQYGIKEGARRHHEMNTLTSTVNSVKLDQEEQNSAQQILDLLNEGDYQTALERALSFGKNRMTIYLLLIHELTFGRSKDSKFKLEVLRILFGFFKDQDDLVWAWDHDLPQDRGDFTVFIYKYHVELLSLGLNSAFLNKMPFGEGAVINLLDNKVIEPHEIIEYNLLGSKCDLLFLFDRDYSFNDKSNFIEHVNMETGELATIHQNMLSSLRGAIDDIIYELDKLDDIEQDILERLGKLIDIIINNNLIEWLQAEALDIILLGNTKQLCHKTPYLTSCFVKLLTALDKIPDAIELLEMRAQKSPEGILAHPDQYIESNNNDYRDMSIYLFKKDKIKDSLYFLKLIEDTTYNVSDMLKGDAYLAFAEYLIEKENNDKAIEYIDKVHNIIFSLKELDEGRKTSENEYRNNIDLHIRLFQIYSKIGKNDKALECINQALSLVSIIRIRIFKDAYNSMTLKYWSLGKICKILYDRGYKKESKEIVDNFTESLQTFKSQMDQYRAVEKMYDKIEGLYVKEFVVLFKKYPLHGNISLGYARLFNSSSNIKFLDIIIDGTNIPKSFVKRHLERIYNSFNYKDSNIALEKLEKNPQIFIKIIGEKEYRYHLNKFIKLQNIDVLARVKLALLESFKVDRVQLHFDQKIYKKMDSRMKNIIAQADTKDRTEQYLSDVSETEQMYHDESHDEFTNLENLIKNLEININRNAEEFEDIKEIISRRKKLLIEDKDKIDIILCPILIKSGRLYLDFIYSLINEISSPQIKANVYFDCGLVILNNQEKSRPIVLEVKDPNNENKQIIKENKEEAQSMLNLSCKTLFEVFREGYSQEEDFIEDVIKVSLELINQGQIQAILEITEEFKDLLVIKNKPGSFYAPITGMEMPFNYIYEIYESICKSLIDKEIITEAFTISEYMLEKNQIANIYIYYINKLVDKGDVKLALNHAPKILDLIDSSEPLPTDNSIWPVKGYSYLKLVDFYIKISEIDYAKKFIDKALLEVFPINQELSLEAYIDSYLGNQTTHFNEKNKSEFLYELIEKLLKIDKIDKAIHLLNDIDPSIDLYYTGYRAKEKGLQGYTVSFYNSALKDIAWKIFDEDKIKAFELVHYNKKLTLFSKRGFYSQFFSKIDFQENITTWKSYFIKDMESFILPIAANFLENLEPDSEYIYLSNFPVQTQTFSNVLFAKSYEYLISKTKPDEEKLDLLSKVIDIDKWRKISASI